MILRKTAKLLYHWLTYLLVKALLKVIWICLWQAPSKVWGKWVVLGAYIIPFLAIGVASSLTPPRYLLFYCLVWLYFARWRWNYAKYRSGVKPLFERRNDV